MKRIAIFGPPRSGTSWLAHIFNSHPSVVLRFQPLFSYGHKAAISPSSSIREINVFFEEIKSSSDPYALMQTESQNKYPVFSKVGDPTHLFFKETRYLNVMRNMLERDFEFKLIGIIRNPLAALASWIRAPKEFSADWSLSEEWRFAPRKNRGQDEEYFGYEKWKCAAIDFLSFQREFPERFRLVRYGELNSNTEAIVSELFEFCDLRLHPATKAFIDDSKSRHDRDPYSVWRANANDEEWKAVLPEHISDVVFSDLKGTDLEAFL
jgi:hypothetical protein